MGKIRHLLKTPESRPARQRRIRDMTKPKTKKTLKSPKTRSKAAGKLAKKPQPASKIQGKTRPAKGETKPKIDSRILVKTKLSPAFLKQQKQRLLNLRDSLLDQMNDVAHESIRDRPVESTGLGIHQGDAGSETYDRDFALTILSQEQDVLYEIEEAIKRIDDKTYGICEICYKPISKERLLAMPFARFTVDCQSQMERDNSGKRRWKSDTPFAEMMGRSEEEGEEDSDEERKKE